MKKLPPEEKIYEAWTAVADGRVKIDEDASEATVMSSDGSRCYTVRWNKEHSVYQSNDMATMWQGYAGYPVISVMMLQGLLPLERTIAELYRDVNWKRLNMEYKRNYAAAVAETEAVRNIDPEEPLKAVRAVMHKLEDMPVSVTPLRSHKTACH